MKNPLYRHYYLKIEKMKRNQICLFLIIWIIGKSHLIKKYSFNLKAWLFILAISSLGPNKISEETLSKKCQEDLELKNFTNVNQTKIKCLFCHKNIHENVKKFTYIATLLPKEDSFQPTNYSLNGTISSFQQLNSKSSCSGLLNYTTW